MKIVLKSTLKILFAGILLALTACCNNKNQENMNNIEQKEHYTFELSDKVTRQKVTFKKSLWNYAFRRFVHSEKPW